jgi:DNA-directed RNA polymerase subunit RPC12/RpoP
VEKRNEIRCPYCNKLHGIVVKGGGFSIEILCKCKRKFVAKGEENRIKYN